MQHVLLIFVPYKFGMNMSTYEIPMLNFFLGRQIILNHKLIMSIVLVGKKIYQTSLILSISYFNMEFSKVVNILTCNTKD